MAVIELNGENIFETIQKSLCVFINFSSPEKKQSIEFTQMFERFSEKNIVEGFEITKTPTLMVYLEGQELRNIPGGCDEATMKASINETLIEFEEAGKK